jgi:hypothetical protein
MAGVKIAEIEGQFSRFEKTEVLHCIKSRRVEIREAFRVRLFVRFANARITTRTIAEPFPDPAEPSKTPFFPLKTAPTT